MKHDATGRSKGGRFARLDHSLLSSPAYRSLSPNARSLLVELAMMENGRNNGTLYLSVRDAADRMGVADTSAATAAFTELEEMGFIACTRDAHFAVKAGEGSRARCWRITWQSTPALKIGPTGEYRDREPAPGSRANKRMIAGCSALKRHRGLEASGNLPVLDSATLNPKRVAKSHTMGGLTGGLSVADSATRLRENGGNASERIVRDSATHTACQLEERCEEPDDAGSPKARVSSGGRAADRRSCEQCGQPFDLERPDRNHRRRFCSELCRKAAEKTRAAHRRADDDAAQLIADAINRAAAHLGVEPQPTAIIPHTTGRRAQGGRP